MVSFNVALKIEFSQTLLYRISSNSLVLISVNLKAIKDEVITAKMPRFFADVVQQFGGGYLEHLQTAVSALIIWVNVTSRPRSPFVRRERYVDI